jgi:pantoate--beta-alanine ligase
MKLIKHITDLNKAINRENGLGFVPTMGSLHKGHEALIKKSQKKCKKTLVTIFVNPTQFNSKKDYKNYPKNINKDLQILKKLKVDFVYLPTVDQIFNTKKFPKILLKKSQKILCAKFRKGHFEGVLDVLNRFVILISPKFIFMGEKDYQQFILVKDFIEKNYKTKVYICKTVRDSNKIALSSRNNLLDKTSLYTLSIITNKLHDLKKKIYKHKQNSKKLIQLFKRNIVKEYKVKIQYLECRNIVNLSTNIHKKSFKLFVAYYLGNVRLIDNF